LYWNKSASWYLRWLGVARILTSMCIAPMRSFEFTTQI
jgi:hypothetical protein